MCQASWCIVATICYWNLADRTKHSWHGFQGPRRLLRRPLEWRFFLSLKKEDPGKQIGGGDLGYMQLMWERERDGPVSHMWLPGFLIAQTKIPRQAFLQRALSSSGRCFQIRKSMWTPQARGHWGLGYRPNKRPDCLELWLPSSELN